MNDKQELELDKKLLVLKSDIHMIGLILFIPLMVILVKVLAADMVK